MMVEGVPGVYLSETVLELKSLGGPAGTFRAAHLSKISFAWNGTLLNLAPRDEPSRDPVPKIPKFTDNETEVNTARTTREARNLVDLLR